MPIVMSGSTYYTSPLRRALLVALCGLSMACNGGIDSTAVVRDSLGVTIVDNTDPVWSGEEAWVVADTPSVDIFHFPGDTALPLTRATSAVRLSDGRIVIANTATRQLLYYDASGNEGTIAGGRGGRPGRFNTLNWIQRSYRGTILAWDEPLRWTSEFAPNGAHIRTFLLKRPPDGDYPMVLGQFGDGSLLTTPNVDLAERLSSGAARDTVLLTRHDVKELTLIDTIGRFVDDEVIMVWDHAVGGFGTVARAFGRVTSVVPHADLLYVATGDRYQVDVYDLTGALRRSIRLAYALRPLTEDDKARWRAEVPRHFDAATADEVMRSMAFPDSVAPYRTVRLDDESNLWVERYPETARPRWDVFNAEDYFLGSVELPAGFEAYQFGTDYVLGRAVTADGAEHIQVLTLAKPE